MGNIDGIPLTLENGEAAPTAQQSLIVGGVDAAGLGQRLQTSSSGGLLTARHLREGDEVGVDFFEPEATDGQYFMVIDLNFQAAGRYKHSGGQFFTICGGAGAAVKSAAADKWSLRLGTILRINGTDSDIGWLHLMSIHDEDTTTVAVAVNDFGRIGCIDLTYNASGFTKISAGDIETAVTAINTGVTIPDISGEAKTPAAGDLICRADRIAGAGTLKFHWHLRYFSTL